LLAAFGDAGAGAVPWLVGALADVVGARPDTVAAWVPSWLAEDSPSALGLRLGLLGAALFPALLLLVVRFVPELRSGPTDQPQGP
jgi:hypothetical protein